MRICCVVTILMMFVETALTQPSPTVITPKRALLYNKVEVVSHGGTRHLLGLLAGLDGDSLVVLSREGRVKVSRRDVQKVTIEADGGESLYTLDGLVLGAYVADLLLLTIDSERFAYVKDPTTLRVVGFTAFGAFVGGGVMYMLEGLFSKDEEVFTFVDDSSSMQREWERLRVLLLGERPVTKLHLSVHGGQVHARLPAAGAYVYSNQSYFNLLRSLSVTYTLTPTVEIGVMALWFGEPPWRNYKYETRQYNWSYEEFKAMGYHAICSYRVGHLIGLQRSPLDCRIGGGVGLAEVDYSYYQLYQYSETVPGQTNPTWKTVRLDKKIKRDFLSGVLFGEIDANISRDLSLGLEADYVLVPQEKRPAVPQSNIPEGRLGNYSLGFKLGLHF
jgi:hypothetical protein